ncbi:uncharacterized protein ZAP3 [Chelonus insularis]|uniref:uncharacterized protein ZAP3 n=1 Tax=Chelonus insularis TaxID=460826 RepID=UPI00158E5068|nr:uncharacterized protein LOC118068336 [Chelonus insularis]
MQNWNQWQLPTGNTVAGTMPQPPAAPTYPTSGGDPMATMQAYMQYYNQPAPSGYTAEQWAAAQQQNWAQWQQWQQQYQQWQAQYGAKYQESVKQMSASGITGFPAMPTVPPPLPKDDTSIKPPLPPDNANMHPTSNPPPHQNNLPLFPSKTAVNPPLPPGQPPPPPDNPSSSNDDLTGVKRSASTALDINSAKKSKNEDDELTDAEKTFDAQFKQWEEQFNKWKQQNANHPDKAQYKQYEAKWTSWREKLIERREQMRKKREAQKAKNEAEKKKNLPGGDKLMNILSNTENQGLINNLLGIGKTLGLSGKEDSSNKTTTSSATASALNSSSTQSTIAPTMAGISSTASSEMNQQVWAAQQWAAQYSMTAMPVTGFPNYPPPTIPPIMSSTQSMSTTNPPPFNQPPGGLNAVPNFSQPPPGFPLNTPSMSQPMTGSGNNQDQYRQDNSNAPFQKDNYNQQSYDRFNSDPYNSNNRRDPDNDQGSMNMNRRPRIDSFNCDRQNRFNDDRNDFSGNRFRNDGPSRDFSSGRDNDFRSSDSFDSRDRNFHDNNLGRNDGRFRDQDCLGGSDRHSFGSNFDRNSNMNNPFGSDNRMNNDRMSDNNSNMNRFDSMDKRDNFMSSNRNMGRNNRFEPAENIPPELKKLMEKRKAAADVFKPSGSFLSNDKSSTTFGSLSESFKKITGSSPFLPRDRFDSNRGPSDNLRGSFGPNNEQRERFNDDFRLRGPDFRSQADDSFKRSDTGGPSRGPNDFGSNRGPNNFGLNRGPNDFGPNRGPNDFGPNREPNDFGLNRGSNDFGLNRGSNDFGPNRGSNDFGRNRGSNDFMANRNPNDFGPNRGFNDSGPRGQNLRGPDIDMGKNRHDDNFIDRPRTPPKQDLPPQHLRESQPSTEEQTQPPSENNEKSQDHSKESQLSIPPLEMPPWMDPQIMESPIGQNENTQDNEKSTNELPTDPKADTEISTTNIEEKKSTEISSTNSDVLPFMGENDPKPEDLNMEPPPELPDLGPVKEPNMALFSSNDSRNDLERSNLNNAPNEMMDRSKHDSFGPRGPTGFDSREPDLMRSRDNDPFARKEAEPFGPRGPDSFKQKGPEIFEARRPEPFGPRGPAPFDSRGHDSFDSRRQEPFGPRGLEQFGPRRLEPFDTGRPEPFGSKGSEPFESRRPEPFGPRRLEPFDSERPEPFGPRRLEPFGPKGLEPFESRRPEPFGPRRLEPFDTGRPEPFGPRGPEPFDTGRPEPFGPRGPEPFDTGRPEPFGPRGPEPFGPRGPEPFDSGRPDPFGPRRLEPFDSGRPEPFGPRGPEPFGPGPMNNPRNMSGPGPGPLRGPNDEWGMRNPNDPFFGPRGPDDFNLRGPNHPLGNRGPDDMGPRGPNNPLNPRPPFGPHCSDRPFAPRGFNEDNLGPSNQPPDIGSKGIPSLLSVKFDAPIGRINDPKNIHQPHDRPFSGDVNRPPFGPNIIDENIPPMRPERDHPRSGFPGDQFNLNDKMGPPPGPRPFRNQDDPFLRPPDPLSNRPPFGPMNRDSGDRFNVGPSDLRDDFPKRMHPDDIRGGPMRPEFCIEKQYNYNHGGRLPNKMPDEFIPSKVIDYGHLKRPVAQDYATPAQCFEYSHGKNKPCVPEHEIYPRMEFKHWIESEYNLKEYHDSFRAYKDYKNYMKKNEWKHRNEPIPPWRGYDERVRYEDRKPSRERDDKRKKKNQTNLKDQRDHKDVKEYKDVKEFKDNRNKREREQSWEREIEQLHEKTLRSQSNLEDRTREKSDRSLKESNTEYNKEEERSKGNISRPEKSANNSANSTIQELSNQDVSIPEAPSPPRTLELAKLSNITMVADILYPPGRQNRPPKIVIILRGPPGSGKSYVAKLIKDKEVEQGGSAPRILSLDDYFLIEKEVESIDDNGKKIIYKEMVYEYEEAMEPSYVTSLVKAFKKNITDGFFNFIILDCINEKISDYEEMWSFAKSKGFRVYVCEMEMDVQICLKRNIHKRTEEEVNRIVDYFEPTPNYHQILDVSTLLQEQTIEEVQMEEVKTSTDEEKVTSANDDSQDSQEDQLNPVGVSKWEKMEAEDKLDRLDGLAKRKNEGKPQTMEDFLQVPDYYNMEDTSGKKRVRWADLEERKEQEKMRAVGFVVGQTNWNRMMDPTKGSSALTRTKYFNLT